MPIGDRIFFAGEHTSILFDVGGTMEAAAESAERRQSEREWNALKQLSKVILAFSSGAATTLLVQAVRIR